MDVLRLTPSVLMDVLSVEVSPVFERQRRAARIEVVEDLAEVRHDRLRGVLHRRAAIELLVHAGRE